MDRFNKRGEIKGMTIIVIALLVVAAYMFVPSVKTGIDGIFNKQATPAPSSSESSPAIDTPTSETTTNCPSTMKTSLTINIQDELTSSATNINSEYYIFNGNSLVLEGNTGTDGTDTVDVTCGKDYSVVLLNTTAGASATTGAYAKTEKVQARYSTQPLNVQLTRFGTAKILGIENPADPARNANVSLTAGGTKNFDLKFSANYTEKGFNKPTIMCQVNSTEIQDVNGNTFSDGTEVVETTSLPTRVSANAGFKYYGFVYPKMLTPAMGVRTLGGTIVVANSITPGTTSMMNCTVIDQATWKTADYKIATKPEDGFKEGMENTENNNDVGGGDATQVPYYFYSSGGY